MQCLRSLEVVHTHTKSLIIIWWWCHESWTQNWGEKKKTEREVLPGYDQDSFELLRLLHSLFRLLDAEGQQSWGEKQMMNHRRQNVHNRDVSTELCVAICRPFIISGLQKHNRAKHGLSMPPPPLSPAPILPLPWFAPLIPCSHPLIIFSPSPPKTSLLSSFHSPSSTCSHPPSTLLEHRSPPNVCLWVENTIIYSFVSSSLSSAVYLYW